MEHCCFSGLQREPIGRSSCCIYVRATQRLRINVSSPTLCSKKRSRARSIRCAGDDIQQQQNKKITSNSDASGRGQEQQPSRSTTNYATPPSSPSELVVWGGTLPSSRRLLVGTIGFTSLAAGANFLGSTSALLGLAPDTARSLRLDVLFPVEGYLRCYNTQLGFGEWFATMLLRSFRTQDASMSHHHASMSRHPRMLRCSTDFHVPSCVLKRWCYMPSPNVEQCEPQCFASRSM